MFNAPQPSSLSGYVVPLAGGMAGIRQTLRAMRALVNHYKCDPHVRLAASNLIYLQPEKDGFHEARALFEFVRDEVRYMQDVYGVETIQSPDKTLEMRVGDCDDQSVLLATLLEAVGYPTRFVCAGYIIPGQLEHVYMECLVGEFVIPMDPTERESFGFEPSDPVTLFYEQI